MFYPPWNYYAFECKYLTRSRQKLEISEYLKISAFVSTWHHENTICIVLQRLKNLGVVLPLESDELLGWSVWLRTTSHANRRSVIISVSLSWPASLSELLWHYSWRSVLISVSVSVSKIIRYYDWYQYEMLSTLYCSSAKECPVDYLSCMLHIIQLGNIIFV